MTQTVEHLGKPKRRWRVTDPDTCRTCRHAQNGASCAGTAGTGKVLACIGYFPAMQQV